MDARLLSKKLWHSVLYQYVSTISEQNHVLLPETKVRSGHCHARPTFEHCTESTGNDTAPLNSPPSLLLPLIDSSVTINLLEEDRERLSRQEETLNKTLIESQKQLALSEEESRLL